MKDQEAAADWGIDWGIARNDVFGLGMPSGGDGGAPFMSVFGGGVVVRPPPFDKSLLCSRLVLVLSVRTDTLQGVIHP